MGYETECTPSKQEGFPRLKTGKNVGTRKREKIKKCKYNNSRFRKEVRINWKNRQDPT